MDFIAGLFAFFIEVTIHALVFIFHLIMAAFSAEYRAKLKKDWDTSWWKRAGIVLGILLYSAALLIALLVWTSVIELGSKPTKTPDTKPPIPINLTPSDLKDLKETKEVGDLIDTAEGILKQKLEEHRQRKQDQSNESKDPAESPSE